MQLKSPFGIIILNSILTREFNSTSVEFVIPESDTDDFFINDVISGINQTDDDGIQYCKRSVPGQAVRGTIVGFEVEGRKYEDEIYRRGGTKRKAKVCEDPFIRCKAMVNDIVQDTDIGKTLNIDNGSGNTSTGFSKIQLDYSTLIQDGGQFRILKILEKVDTSSDPFYPEKYTIIECMIANHELLASNIVSSGLWSRISSILIPTVPSDAVNVGGGLVDGDVTIPVLVGDAQNTTFKTIKQNIIGAVNEIFDTPSGANAVEDILPVTSNGQTSFTLSSEPVSDAAFALYLNGQLRRRTVDYNRSGTNVTWLDPSGLTLITTDELIARYNDAGGVVETVPIARQEILPVTSNGQTAFSVTYDPVSDYSFHLYLNGQLRDQLIEYTIVGKNVTWLDPSGLTLKTTDVLTASYNSISTACIKEVWLAGINYTTNLSNYRTRSTLGTGNVNFTFNVPDDFGTLVHAKLIGIVSTGAAGINKDIDLTSDYAPAGQPYNLYSESDTTTTYDLSGLGNKTAEILDFSVVLSNIAASQYVGINVDHNSLGGAINYLGIKFKYIVA